MLFFHPVPIKNQLWSQNHHTIWVFMTSNMTELFSILPQVPYKACTGRSSMPGHQHLVIVQPLHALQGPPQYIKEALNSHMWQEKG